ncbi:MAG: hypothetical protein KME30_17240 [Iphinoe sp. HA4291-MV1]|jgi:hypothetical protein|nr:hypothetical protein [Iphinoe sp. HA4291-MV1]
MLGNLFLNSKKSSIPSKYHVFLNNGITIKNSNSVTFSVYVPREVLNRLQSQIDEDLSLADLLCIWARSIIDWDQYPEEIFPKGFQQYDFIFEPESLFLKDRSYIMLVTANDTADWVSEQAIQKFQAECIQIFFCKDTVKVGYAFPHSANAYQFLSLVYSQVSILHMS